MGCHIGKSALEVTRETYHYTLRQIRLGYDDGTHLLQQRNKDAVLRSWLEGTANISQGAVVALDVELVLERYWDAVQRSHSAPIAFEELVEFTSSY
jgi:hypothetical protein